MNILKTKEILSSLNQLNNELEKETGFKIGEYVGWKGSTPVELKSIVVCEEIICGNIFTGTVELKVPLDNLYKMDKETLKELYGLKQKT